MSEQLESEFHEAMVNIYRRAKSEADYDAKVFIQKLETHGGVAYAKMLINAPAASQGYTALWQRQRLDLTVEAMIQATAKYHPLFTENELAACAERLKEYEYQI